MSELALAIIVLFSAVCGGLITWMWMYLREQDLQAELEDVYAKYAEWVARALATETRVAWLTSYINRLDQELELERIVSESYAAGIAKEER